MIITGILRQNDEPVAFGKVYISDAKGNYIEGANNTTTDELGNYSITITDNELDQYVTFSNFAGKKTLSYSDLDCSSAVCQFDIDLADTFLPEINAVAFLSFWDKYKYWIVSIILILLTIFVIYKIRK